MDVRGTRFGGEIPCCDDRGRSSQRGSDDEATPARLALEQPGRLAHQPVGERDPLARAAAPVARDGHADVFGHRRASRAAAIVFGSAVSARNVRYTPIATSSTNGAPASG